MSNEEWNRTREGYQWTTRGGLQPGVSTTAVVKPSSNLDRGADTTVFDVIVIGAGYGGLTATRDLTTSGAKVLLLEARDRIGGRTFTSMIDGHKFEMGGTYIHWTQPNLWREIARYGMQTGLDAAVDLSVGITAISLISPAESKVISQDEQVSPYNSMLARQC